MVTNLNIDELVNRIQDPRTRENIDEVLSCYYSGNYRSAIVMLYSVVMCDLIYKLQRMKDIYNDEVSDTILTELERLQSENPASAAWENKLREELLNNKRVITTAEALHIDSLQKERHLCAHPVIRNNAELHKPNKASVYAHIVTALDEILTRPALLENKLLDLILEDTAAQRQILGSPSEFLQYVREKFLDKIKSSEIEQKLIVGLWKIVFKLTNEDAKKNRKINLLLLEELCRRNIDSLKELVMRNAEKLSSRIDISDLNTLVSFVRFMNAFPNLYELISPPTRIAIEAQISKYPILKNISFFFMMILKITLKYC